MITAILNLFTNPVIDDTSMISHPISTMEESFKSIAISLNIPLEARGQLTPEVVKVIEAMSVNDYGKPDGVKQQIKENIQFFNWIPPLNSYQKSPTQIEMVQRLLKSLILLERS